MTGDVGQLCLMCGGDRFRPLYSGIRDRYGIAHGSYEFVACEECGSANLCRTPSGDELRRLYPKDYLFRRDHYRGSVPKSLSSLEWHLFYRPVNAHKIRVVRKLTGVATGLVLEVGFGSGTLMRMLTGLGYATEGVETSEENVVYVRGSYGYRVYCGTLEQVKLEQDRYDLVALFYVLEHSIDPGRDLAEALRILKPGGCVIVCVPVIDSWQARLFSRRWAPVTEAPRHVCIPSSRGVARILTRVGFVDIRRAPVSTLDAAAHVALSLFSRASTVMSYGQQNYLKLLGMRVGGAALTLFALPLALVERMLCTRSHCAGAMIFTGRKRDD